MSPDLYVYHFDFSDLQLNRLICDCNLKWMIKWMANMKSKGRSLSVLGRCELPFAVKDKKIVDLNKKEMVCGKNNCKIQTFHSKEKNNSL